jgi:hypothetical protein
MSLASVHAFPVKYGPSCGSTASAFIEWLNAVWFVHGTVLAVVYTQCLMSLAVQGVHAAGIQICPVQGRHVCRYFAEISAKHIDDLQPIA